MNTPNVLTVMPGDRYLGDDPEGFMTCDEFVDMVYGYARRHRLPILENTAVIEVRPIEQNYEVLSQAGSATARSIVIATGNLNVPRRPTGASKLPASINQIDGSQYRDAGSLPPGAVLVIGCGNSGGQIAEDLARAGRSVFLSTGRNGRIPRRYRNRDIILWLVDNGRMSKPRTTSTGRPLLGATHTISLQSLSALGVTLMGRFEGVLPDGIVMFANSLAESAAFGDQVSEEIRREIDAYIEQAGINAPEAVADEAETVIPRFPDPPILRLHLATTGITTVIWSTGFVGDYGWLRVPGAIAASGHPVQEKGVSVPGIYFAGLDSPESLMAGTILMVEEESDRIVGHIIANRGKLPGQEAALA
jgi:putative flavoprotein involved in K+ transport